MAATEPDIIRDEAERSNLQRAIADLETAIVVSNPGTRRVLEMSLAGAKGRVSTLDKRIEEAKVEHAAEVQTQAAIAAAALAAKETALNAKERETYKGFLEEAYFTKKDLGRLDVFYTHSYDRLSEDGKEEMSQRLHEGLRRGELKVTDLTKAIRERDDAHCAAKAKRDPSDSLHRDASSISPRPTKRIESMAVEDIDLGSVNLMDIKLAEVTGNPSASTLPEASNAKVTQR